jgi:hypothetical protein
MLRKECQKEKRYIWCGGIVFDESAMLFSRGKLCRGNPMSA